MFQFYTPWKHQKTSGILTGILNGLMQCYCYILHINIKDKETGGSQVSVAKLRLKVTLQAVSCSSFSP